jgi:hypothetical protein
MIFKINYCIKGSNGVIKMNKQNKKSILSRAAPIFTRLAPLGSLLRCCLDNSKWDDENVKTESKASYDQRLSISKLLPLILEDCNNSRHLLKLLNSDLNKLTVKDVWLGFKSIELLLLSKFSHNKALAYSRNSRYFLKEHSPKNVQELFPEAYRPSVLGHIDSYKPNSKVGLFEINITSSFGKFYIDPDFYEHLFVEGSILVDLIGQLAVSSEAIPLSDMRILRTTLNKINYWGTNSPTIKLLNQSSATVNAESLLESIRSFEKELYLNSQDKRPELVSSQFRKLLFTYAFPNNPELAELKGTYKSVFNAKGTLNFIPSYTINTDLGHFKIDTFQIPTVAKTDGIAAKNLSILEKQSFKNPIHQQDINNIFEVLKAIEKHDLQNAHFVLSRPSALALPFHIRKAFKEIETYITSNFVHNAIEVFSLFLRFVSIDTTPTKNGKPFGDISYQPEYAPKAESISFQTVSKSNGKKNFSSTSINITKIKKISSSDGILYKSLIKLKKESENKPVTLTTLRNLNLTLNCIINTASDNDLICDLLNSPIEHLNQRDFRLAFKQLEDIIDEQDISIKSNKSQSLRTFLSKYAGKINNKIAVKNCGFNSRFKASKEINAQKLIEPIDYNGDLLPSPTQTQHLSLVELKKSINDYYQKPINQVLEACKKEIQSYKGLLSKYEKYSQKDEEGQYKIRFPEALADLVKLDQGSQKRDNRKLSDSILESYSSEMVLACYTRAQHEMGTVGTIYCTNKSKLIPKEVKHWFSLTGKGFSDLFWFELLLPKNVLLACFLRLVVRTTWNKDAIAQLSTKDIPETIPNDEYKITGFKDKVGKPTSEVKIEPHEKEINETIALLIQHNQNMRMLGFTPDAIWETPKSTNLSFLNSTLAQFIEHYQLPRFSIELLAKHMINLRKGIDGDLFKSQQERNHASSRVTASYLTHPIALVEYEANNADFQRRFETTVQFRHDENKLEKYGFAKTNIDENLLIASNNLDDENLPDWFLLPDGSSCMDIFANVDRSKKDSFCKGRKCHSEGGCEFNRVEIGVTEFTHTLRQQAFYISRGEHLLNKRGKEYFDEYIAPSMRFTFGLVKYVEYTNPVLFNKAKEAMNDER